MRRAYYTPGLPQVMPIGKANLLRSFSLEASTFLDRERLPCLACSRSEDVTGNGALEFTAYCQLRRKTEPYMITSTEVGQGKARRPIKPLARGSIFLTEISQPDVGFRLTKTRLCTARSLDYSYIFPQHIILDPRVHSTELDRTAQRFRRPTGGVAQDKGIGAQSCPFLLLWATCTRLGCFWGCPPACSFGHVNDLGRLMT